VTPEVAGEAATPEEIRGAMMMSGMSGAGVFPQPPRRPSMRRQRLAEVIPGRPPTMLDLRRDRPRDSNPVEP
jgi:hypothetical protein